MKQHLSHLRIPGHLHGQNSEHVDSFAPWLEGIRIVGGNYRNLVPEPCRLRTPFYLRPP